MHLHCTVRADVEFWDERGEVHEPYESVVHAMAGFQPLTGVLKSVWPRSHRPSASDHRSIAKIRERARENRDLTDRELVGRADTLRQAVECDANVSDENVAIPAMALVNEAVRRTLGFEYYDVQFLAGLALSRNSIAEMHTGEGKTIVAALPAFIFALAGRGVHVMTVNTYLATRDWETVSPALQLLGKDRVRGDP